MLARNGRTGSSCGCGSCSRSHHRFTGPGGQKVDGSLIGDRTKFYKVVAYSVFVVAGGFELISNSSDDVVNARLARDEILPDGDAFKRVVCCSITLAGPIASSSEIVSEDLAFELIGSVGDADEVFEDCQGRAECFGGAGWC